ncbi:MAG: 8-amino-7-oxononanoate synthase [Candidatus Omnitrophota bacterium]
MERIKEFLNKRQQDSLLRTLKPFSLREKGFVCIGGKRYVDFSSNDYLGLSSHPYIKKNAKDAIDKFGAGICSSRLLSGDIELFGILEKRIADFKQKESALIFNSGYQANLGIISAICGKNDVVFSDRLNHASIVDGILLSGAKLFRFNHNDIGHLETLLKKHRAKFQRCLIITESIFSMDGDLAPIREIVKLKKKYTSMLLVDEAHATGIFGDDGSGVVASYRLSDDVDLIMGTFGKALGSFGAYLACSKPLRDLLINKCRSFIYSTALSPAVIASNIAAVDIVRYDPFRRQLLLEKANYLREQLRSKGFEVLGSSQIIPVVIGESRKTVLLSEKLQEKGYWALPIRPPTVPEGSSRIRFSLNYYHRKSMLKKLAEDMATLS